MTPKCPKCGIEIDSCQMDARQCNSCLHTWSHLHVMVADEMHKETYLCECLPKLEYLNYQIVVVHNSFEGKESGSEWWREMFQKNQ